jgi:hypothetical protein
MLIQTVLIIVANRLYLARNPTNIGLFGSGLCASSYASTVSFLSFLLLSIDLCMPSDANNQQTDKQYHFVFANMMFIWYLVIFAYNLDYGWYVVSLRRELGI